MNFDPATPWKDLSDEVKAVILYGTGQTRVDYDIKRKNSEFKFSRKFEGVIPNLDRRYREPIKDFIFFWACV